MLRSMSAAAQTKISVTTCAGSCLHSCARVCVYACVDQSRARVHVGAWVDAGLCVPMTVRSAANAIGTILKFDCFSGRTADLRMFLQVARCQGSLTLTGPRCSYVTTQQQYVSRQRQRQREAKPRSPRLHLKEVCLSQSRSSDYALA
jgi:hypothetical protein